MTVPLLMASSMPKRVSPGTQPSSWACFQLQLGGGNDKGGDGQRSGPSKRRQERRRTHDSPPSRTPTMTLMPLSRALRPWPWPCEP
jgi:hypothetical protein